LAWVLNVPSVAKKEDSGFYRILAIDQPTDKEQLEAALAANKAKETA